MMNQDEPGWTRSHIYIYLPMISQQTQRIPHVKVGWPRSRRGPERLLDTLGAQGETSCWNPTKPSKMGKEPTKSNKQVAIWLIQHDSTITKLDWTQKNWGFGVSSPDKRGIHPIYTHSFWPKSLGCSVTLPRNHQNRYFQWGQWENVQENHIFRGRKGYKVSQSRGGWLRLTHPAFIWADFVFFGTYSRLQEWHMNNIWFTAVLNIFKITVYKLRCTIFPTTLRIKTEVHRNL